MFHFESNYNYSKMKTLVWIFNTLVLLVSFVQSESPCAARQFDQDSIVCVCNSTYCDNIAFEKTKTSYEFPYFYAFVSSKSGDRMKYHTGSIMPQEPNEIIYNLGAETVQTIFGFGGAFTDSATTTIDKLSSETRNNLLQSYFGKNGIGYTMGRVPMASCDFSSHAYSYDDNANDFNLTLFKLADEDLKHKIPFIKDAIKVSAVKISLFGSPWSCPSWMKTNDNMTGSGSLKGQPGGPYFKTWADYFVKFLQAYEKQGVSLWGITAQNEPSDGLIPFITIPSLGWTPELQRDFIAKDLGPALESAGFGDVKLMILDDQRRFLPQWAEVVLGDKEAARYVSGIAVHWYEDQMVPASALDETYTLFGQDYFILNTEACEQDTKYPSKSVLLGNWERGEHYFSDILEDLKHGVSGWVDWNIALDMQGGPNWVNNFADSPIIVNPEGDEFYKQPMFYAMAHFSKFVTPGSKILSYTANNFTEYDDLQEIFFQTDKNSVVANFININKTTEYSVSIDDSTLYSAILNFNIPPSSMITITWYRSWIEN